MRSISDFYVDNHSMLDRINESLVEEGLKEKIISIYNSAKEKWKGVADKIIQGIKNVYAKFNYYLIPIQENGELLPTVGGYTMGLAYKMGAINKDNTFIKMDKEGEKITGLKTKLSDARKIYGNTSTLSYWKQIYKESANDEVNNINEVRLKNQDPEAEFNVIDDGDELKKDIRIHLLNRKLARLMIWGAPGIGKTAILDNVLHEFEEFDGYKLVVKTLANETPENFMLPDYVVVNGERRSTDVAKSWLPVYKETGDPAIDAASDEACGKGLLFIDELSRATAQVRNVLLPLINEGRLNDYKLGSNWGIICASNRDEDELEGQTPIGNALSNRFAHIYFEPTCKSWKKWAEKEGYMSPLLLQWLSMESNEEFSGGKFYYMDPNEELNDRGSSTKLMCTPRSWTLAMRELAVVAETADLEGFKLLDIPEKLLAKTLNKYVPASAIKAFIGFLDIIKKIGNFDAAVESVWKNGGKGLKIDSKDLRIITLPLAQLIICARGAKTLPSEEEFNNLTDWVISTGNDQLAAYVYNIFQNVYGSPLPETYRENIYNIAHVVKKRPDVEVEQMNDTYREFLDKYGYKSCTELPDYRPAIEKIIAKFKDIFSSATVNGLPAMA